MNNEKILDQPRQYQIQIKGNLDQKWIDWFDGFSISNQNGNSTLTGMVADQAALHGLISKIRDLGLPLTRIEELHTKNEELTKENLVNTTGKMRAFDITQDFSAMINLVEIAFAGELERWGSNFREQMEMAQQMVPVLKILSRISKTYQHTFDGFVWEEDQEIVSLVIIQKMGLDKTRWLIGNVATHPDYRRKGLAQKLVLRAIEHAKSHGAEICTLEVHANAEPAYNLYRSLGFVHYDSISGLKLDGVPEKNILPLDGYQIRKMKFGEWQARYELSTRETPQDVQRFLPVSMAEHRISPIEKITTPIIMRVQGLKLYRWAIEKDGVLIGSMSLLASKKANIPNDLSITIVPEHRAALAAPLLTLALKILRNYPPQITRVEVRSTYTEMLALLKKYGFSEIDVNHRMGLKLGQE